MEHGASWLSFLPGYHQLEAYLQQYSVGVLGNALVVQHVLSAVLVAIILLVIGVLARGQLARAPDGGLVPDDRLSLRNLLEVVFEALYKLAHQIIGPKAADYFPVIATLALFVFTCNVLGLIPGFSAPTDNWNTTFACGLFVFAYYNFQGLRTNGLHHIAHMANPTGEKWGWWLAPLMFPIELLSHIARPFSLGIRLAANMVGDHAVLMAFLGLCPILVPLPFMVLGLIVCVMQTFVFVLLTMLYLSFAVQEAHHAPSSEAEHAH